ncbi:MAG: trigger factor [Candidatus Cloacimonadota bacterium]|nr:trigger factor [Candidatus Cloacimonadota bacterium]
MKTSIKESSQCVRELTITIESKTAIADYNKIVNQFKKYVAIPGFRKGKAPLSMIEKSFGPQIKDEFYNQKLGDYYKDAIDAENIHPINQGEASEFEWEKGNDLVVTFKYEIMPEIKVKKYKELKIPFEPVKFKKEMIDATLDEYRNKMATETPVETAETGSIIDATIKFLNENNEVTKEVNRKFVLGENQYSKSFNTKLTDAKVEDEFKTKLFTKSQKSEDVDIDNSIKDRDFLVKINAIKQKDIPELNDDFAKDLEYDSLKDLESKLEIELKAKIDKDNKSNMKNAVLAQLIDENTFELPQSIVKQVAENMAKPYAETYKMELDQITNMYIGVAEFNLKGHYLIEEIKKIEEIKISNDEKENIIIKAAENVKMDIEKYKKMYKNQIENNDFIYAAEEDKVIELIKKSSKFVALPKENKKETKK